MYKSNRELYDTIMKEGETEEYSNLFNSCATCEAEYEGKKYILDHKKHTATPKKF